MIPDSNVHGANMGPIWGWQDPDGPHVGPMNLAIWDIAHVTCETWYRICVYHPWIYHTYHNYTTQNLGKYETLGTWNINFFKMSVIYLWHFQEYQASVKVYDKANCYEVTFQETVSVNAQIMHTIHTLLCSSYMPMLPISSMVSSLITGNISSLLQLCITSQSLFWAETPSILLIYVISNCMYTIRTHLQCIKSWIFMSNPSAKCHTASSRRLT